MNYWNEDNNEEQNEIEIFDSNGNKLQNGDSVIVTKDLKVKGGQDIKRGQVYKNIKLVPDDPEHIDCGKVYVKTCYVKKK